MPRSARHVCLAYDDDAERHRRVVGFLVDGVESSQRACLVADTGRGVLLDEHQLDRSESARVDARHPPSPCRALVT